MQCLDRLREVGFWRGVGFKREARGVVCSKVECERGGPGAVVERGVCELMTSVLRQEDVER